LIRGQSSGNGNSFANGDGLPPWARAWEFQTCVWEPRTDIWKVMP
jgi:hypothetical protein